MAFTDEKITTIRTWFGIDGMPERRLNHRLVNPETGRPFEISGRALDDAVFYANEMRDLTLYHQLTKQRAVRAQLVHALMAKVERQIIEDIERGEGWDEWKERIAKS
ncbi:hypothetical protein [Maritimibacter sp. DP1N21-5]|uniref:hypothetical protein n=1 Tax=Maritimibacter sp. DP1N21-5 TaxID=2836867 RepID=UPI001C467CFA|nr:hypothetical protein [Maritimibacter sp. DP1N21-5]MBV7408752.1 hypothetical protein [Maritimibacter sp. DP1N21-5]